jgi:hypothetical protein
MFFLRARFQSQNSFGQTLVMPLSVKCSILSTMPMVTIVIAFIQYTHAEFIEAIML